LKNGLLWKGEEPVKELRENLENEKRTLSPGKGVARRGKNAEVGVKTNGRCQECALGKEEETLVTL